MKICFLFVSENPVFNLQKSYFSIVSNSSDPWGSRS